MPGNPVQFDLFGGSVVYGPPRVFALGPAAVPCPQCVEFVRDDRGCVIWRDAEGLPVRHPARMVTPEPMSDPAEGWVTYPCHEHECGSCWNVAGSDEHPACERCDECDECCSCPMCEYCGNAVDDVCRDCMQCEECCDCMSCDHCGDRSDTICHLCDAGECCCDCIGDIDPEDITVPIIYTAGRSTVGRTFGVELECVGIGPDTAAAALTAAGLVCAGYLGYTHDRCDVWKVVSDASVSGGYEVVSPILSGDDGLHQLHAACGALQANGGTVNASCGTHVHHGMPNATGGDLARVVKFYDRSHTAIDQLHARSRRGAAEWSGPHRGDWETRQIDDIELSSNPANAAASFPRYRSVNVSAFSKYGTVELRQHGGTLNFDKLAAWVEFGQTLITAATAGASPSEDLSTLLATLRNYGLSEDTASFLTMRATVLSAA